MTKTEPVLTVAGVGALAAAIVALLVAFGVPLTDDQQKTILGLVAVLAPVAVAMVARRFVVPIADVVEYQRADGLIAAGPANEALPAGAAVRGIGSLSGQPDPETDPTRGEVAVAARDYLAELYAEQADDDEPADLEGDNPTGLPSAVGEVGFTGNSSGPRLSFEARSQAAFDALEGNQMPRRGTEGS